MHFSTAKKLSGKFFDYLGYHYRLFGICVFGSQKPKKPHPAYFCLLFKPKPPKVRQHQKPAQKHLREVHKAVQALLRAAFEAGMRPTVQWILQENIII